MGQMALTYQGKKMADALADLGLTSDDIDKEKKAKEHLDALGLTKDDLMAGDDIFTQAYKAEVQKNKGLYQGVKKSVIDTGLGLAELGAFLHDRLTSGKKLLPQVLEAGKKSDQSYENETKGNPYHAVGYAGGTLAQLIFPSAILKLGTPINALAKSGKLVQIGSTVGKGAATGLVGGAASYNPSGDVVGAAKKDAAIGAGLSLIFPAAEGIYNAARKLKPIVKSDPKALAALKKAQGYLGQSGIANIFGITDQPSLEKLVDNTAAMVPGSGVEKAQLKAVDQLNSRADKIINDLGKDINLGSNDLDSFIVKDFNDEYKKAKDESDGLFANVAEKAAKAKATVSPDNSVAAAKELSDYINEQIRPDRYRETIDPKTKKPTGEKAWEQQTARNLGVENKYKKILSYLPGFKEKGDYKFSTLKDLRSLLLEEVRDAGERGNDNEKRLFSNLEQAIEKDMNRAANKNPDLFKSWRDANKFYKDNIVPYLTDNDLAKYSTRENKADSNLFVSNFIRQGTGPNKDRDNLITKVVTRLSPEGKKALGLNFLLKNMPNADRSQNESQRLIKAYDKLGEGQRTALFSEEDKKKLDDLSSSVRANKEPLSVKDNPKTGARNKQILGALGLVFAAKNLPSIEVALGAAGLSGASRLAQILAYSPKVREFVIKQAESKDKKIPDALKSASILATTRDD